MHLSTVLGPGDLGLVHILDLVGLECSAWVVVMCRNWSQTDVEEVVAEGVCPADVAGKRSDVGCMGGVDTGLMGQVVVAEDCM